MGIFDFMFNKTGQTPAFNPEQQGFYDPTEEERKRARKMALIQAGAGMLMNNRGNYGEFAPAAGAGLAAGIQGYQQGLQEGPERRMKQLQQQLYAQQVGAVVAGKKKELEEEQAADKQSRFMFASMGLNPDNLENELKGGFMKVSNQPQPITASPVPYVGEGEMPLTTAAGQDLSFVPPTPQKINKVDNLLTKWGYSPEEKDYFYSMAQNDPASAAKTLREEMKARRLAVIKGKKETGKAIGFEDAMILKSQGVEVPGFEAYNPEIAKGYLGQKNINRKAGAPSATASIGDVMVGEASEAAAKKEGFEIGEQAAAIENKWSAIDSVREAKDMLSQGIYSGYWGDVGKTVAKASMGAIGDRQKAARTEQFMSYVGNTVVPRLKEFGGNDSNEEMKYLQRIMGGDITMEPESLAAILDSAERKIARGIERLQRQRGALEQGRMPDLGAGPSRNGVKPSTLNKPAAGGVRKYNPATGRIE